MGVKIYGWLTIAMACLFLMAYVAGLGEVSQPLGLKLTLWIIPAFVLLTGVGLVRQSNTARVMFVFYAALLACWMVWGIVMEIRQGSLGVITMIPLGAVLGYAVYGCSYFLRPSVKALFSTRREG